jgi:AraC family transcriptional regulator of adaptative response / DNA-3-methyladenine glycosylase II
MIQAMELDADACYLALKARDARFDGRFFTGVTSTGIYCRPVCKVKTPRRENCRFYDHAALAETAGFRPCMRCRPELAPGGGLAWSINDASRTLALQAARLLDEPDAWADGNPTLAALAIRLGVSDRHVRRIFEAQFGVAPMQYLQTRRLLTAKQLLTDTALPVTRIAMLSGYASVRRFNAAFMAHYRLNPTQLRRQGGAPLNGDAGIVVRLGYRPPYDAQAMVGFLACRQIDGVEQLHADGLRRTLRIERAGQVHSGWVAARFDSARHLVALTISDSLREVLPQVIRRVRAALDLDADPLAIDALLAQDFPDCAGLRVPGTLDGHELAVRAILGQQVTVAAGRTLTQRVVDRLGERVITPWPELARLFPDAAALAGVPPEVLGELGIVRQRQTAIIALSRAVLDGTLALHPGVDVPSTMQALRALPGVGDWTAQYIAMRALRWPDAFPAGDVALHKAMGIARGALAAREAEAASLAWRPWRSYAVIRAWSQGTPASQAVTPAKTTRKPGVPTP